MSEELFIEVKIGCINGSFRDLALSLVSCHLIGRDLYRELNVFMSELVDVCDWDITDAEKMLLQYKINRYLLNMTARGECAYVPCGGEISHFELTKYGLDNLSRYKRVK